MTISRRHALAAASVLLGGAMFASNARAADCPHNAEGPVEAWLRSLVPKVAANFQALMYPNSFLELVYTEPSLMRAWQEASDAKRTACLAELARGANAAYAEALVQATAKLPTNLAIPSLWKQAQPASGSICMSGNTDCHNFPVPFDCERQTKLSGWLTSPGVRALWQDQERVLAASPAWASKGIRIWLTLPEAELQGGVRVIPALGGHLHQFPYQEEGQERTAMLTLMGEFDGNAPPASKLPSALLRAAPDARALWDSVEMHVLYRMVLNLLEPLYQDARARGDARRAKRLATYEAARSLL